MAVAVFTLTGDLEELVGSALRRSAFVELDRAVTDPTNDVVYEMKGSTPVESVFTLTGLPAKNALNNANADFNMLVTIGKRKWLVPAQTAASTHDLTEFAETTGLVPVDWSNAAAAASSAAAAAASAASVNREAANGVAGLDSGGKLYETRIPTRLGDTVLEGKYLVKGQTATTSVYVATTGNDATNTGLSVGSPFLTIQKAVDYLATQGPLLQGQWYVELAAGTYSPEDVLITTRSVNPVIFRGPAVSGGVPTAIIDGGGNAAGALVTGQQYKHGLWAYGVGVRVEFRDIKAVDFHAGVGDTTRIPFLGEAKASVYNNNCHVVGASWTGFYAFSAGWARVNGGIYDGCRIGVSVNDSQCSIVGGTVIENSTESGGHWSRGAQGHFDAVVCEDNAIGLFVETTSRVAYVGSTFNRNAKAIRTSTGGMAGDGGGNVFGTGADLNTVEKHYGAYTGDTTELYNATSYARVAYDRTLRTHTGNTTETTLSTPYTIPAYRLAGSGKQCRVMVRGIFTAVTALSAVTVNFGGAAALFTVPAAGTNVAFEVDVELLEGSFGYRAIGRIAQGQGGSRMGSVGGGFTSTSDQTITVTVTLANSADTVNIYNTAVYLMG